MISTNDSSGIFRISVMTILMSSTSSIKITSLTLWKKKIKHTWVRLLEHDMLSLARNCQMLRVSWSGALSWWSNNGLLCHNCHLFWQISKHCLIFVDMLVDQPRVRKLIVCNIGMKNIFVTIVVRFSSRLDTFVHVYGAGLKQWKQRWYLRSAILILPPKFSVVLLSFSMSLPN